MLYHPKLLIQASPKAISRRTSYLRVRLEFLRYPQLIPAFFNRRLVRSSMRLYSHFNLAMDRSPGFGSTSCNFSPSSDSLSLRLRSSQILTLPHNVTRRSVLQKVHGRTLIVLPLLVNTGFQVLFHSPPGVLFTFPSRYYALSVTKSYLALGGGPPCFPPDSSCLAVLWYQLSFRSFAYGPFTLFGGAFQLSSAHIYAINAGPQPLGASSSVWAPSLSLAATQEIDVSFSSFRYLDVSVPGVPPVSLCIHHTVTVHYHSRVSPFRYPRIKACLRLPVAFRSWPRLSSALGAIGIHPVLLFA